VEHQYLSASQKTRTSWPYFSYSKCYMWT